MRFASGITSALITGLFVTVLVAPASASVPGMPGVPQPPIPVFQEDFENNLGTTPIGLASYVGATGQAYTADPAWLSNCNGVILEAGSPDSDLPASGCAQLINFSGVRQLAWALGFMDSGAAGALTDHAVSAYTETDNTPAGAVELETISAIARTVTSRFVTFSIEAAAANCEANHALFEFYLLNGSAALPVFSSPIDPCTDPRAVQIDAPAFDGQTARPVHVGRFAANGSLLFSGSSFGIRLINGMGDGNFGNDAAFDDISVLDVTPQLDKSFSPTVVALGQTSTLTLTITNTSDLAAKTGWSLTDALPAGLTIAAPANASTSCANGAVTATPGGSSVSVNGDLNAGQASCSATVNVTSQAAAYTNDASNFTLVGLNPPGSASVRFASSDLAISKASSPTTVQAGGQTTYTLTVHNNGPQDDTDVTVTDPLAAGLTLVAATASQGTCGGTMPVSCALGAIAAGGSAQVVVTVQVAGGFSGTITNTAGVTGTNPDPAPGNNSAGTTVTVPAVTPPGTTTPTTTSAPPPATTSTPPSTSTSTTTTTTTTTPTTTTPPTTTRPPTSTTRPKPPSTGGVKAARTYRINAGRPGSPPALQQGVVGAGVALVVIALLGAALGARRRPRRP